MKFTLEIRTFCKRSLALMGHHTDLKACIPFFITPYRIPRNTASIFNNSFYIYSCSEIKDDRKVQNRTQFIFLKEKMYLIHFV